MSKKKNRKKALRHKLGFKAPKRSSVVRSTGSKQSSSTGGTTQAFDSWTRSFKNRLKRTEKAINEELDVIVAKSALVGAEKQVEREASYLKTMEEQNRPFLPLDKYPKEIRGLGLSVSDEDLQVYPNMDLVRRFVHKAEEIYLDQLEGVSQVGRNRGKRYTQYKVQTITDELTHTDIYSRMTKYFIENQFNYNALINVEQFIKDDLMKQIEAYEAATQIRDIKSLKEREERMAEWRDTFG